MSEVVIRLKFCQCLLMRWHSPKSTLFPYTTLFRSSSAASLRSCFTIETCGRNGPREIRRKPEIGRPCPGRPSSPRSEEHTSELQSLAYLVCRLLLEKKKSFSSEPIFVRARNREESF